jgi:hypothetical protein
MPVSCECCVLLGRDLCKGLITRPGGVLSNVACLECDREALTMKRPRPTRAVEPLGKRILLLPPMMMMIIIIIISNWIYRARNQYNRTVGAVCSSSLLAHSFLKPTECLYVQNP